MAKWAFKWKIRFKPDMNKQASEITFSRNKMKPVHPAVSLNDLSVDCANTQNHLHLFFDKKLYFGRHIKETLCKTTKRINIIN